MRINVCVSCLSAAFALAPADAGDRAVEVMSYEPGATPTPGYTAPSAALGLPERFTGEGVFPAVVSPFNPPWLPSEVVSIGEGGHLTVRLSAPARNRAANPFGLDLILFGNGGFVDLVAPFGSVDPGAPVFGLDDVHIAVSQDGLHFVELGSVTEGWAPTMGFAEGGPYDSSRAGLRHASPFLPLDPSLQPADFSNLDFDAVHALYGLSAGGTGIDIASSGLAEVNFVRFSVPDDFDPSTELNAEIDAITVVPTPAAAAWLLAGLFSRRRR